MTPFHFGPPERRLFGIHHPAAATIETTRGGARGHAVLLCNPFGQEALRCHRMFRVLAERLARDGHSVLRFDYYGTGDSMGDDVEGDLAGWAADIREADRQLRLRSNSTRTVWIGMRLGASVALQAAGQAPVGLARLVLWDPVLDGRRYLQHLRERHEASLDEAFGRPTRPPQTQVDLERDADCHIDEAIGFTLSPLLCEQVQALRLPGHRWPVRPASIVVITDPEDADGGDLTTVCAREPERVRTVALQHGTDWTSDTADNGAIFSAAALSQLVREAGASV